MVSVPSTHLVLFIASIAVAAGVAGAFTAESSRLSATLEDVGVDLSDEVHTDIEIVSDAGSTVYDEDAGEITLAVHNMGETTLPDSAAEVDVFLDGAFQPSANLTVTVQGASSWAPDTVVEIVVSAPALDWGDHRVKVVVDGDEDVLEFSTCAGVDRTRIVFEEEDNDQELAMMNRSGAIERLGVQSKGFSPVAADFDCDGRMEAAFSKDGDPNKDELFIIDHTGEMEQIDDVKVHDRRLGVADDLDGDGKPEIIFANRDDGDNLYRVEYGESPQQILDGNGDDIEARSIGGVIDFNGDGDLDIVFLQGGGSLVYLDNQTVIDTGVNSRGDRNIGSPGDFNGDGEPRVPIIQDAANPIALVDHTGDVYTPPGQAADMADKGSMATIDWDEDGDLDVLFQNKDDNKNLWRIDYDGNMAAILDDAGSRIEISDDGVA